MNLSVIIPCYNEVNSIEKVVHSVIEIIGEEGEIIIVDDFSQDGTRALLQKSIDGTLAKVIYQDKNQGKGAALRIGFAAAKKDIVIVQDADFLDFVSERRILGLHENKARSKFYRILTLFTGLFVKRINKNYHKYFNLPEILKYLQEED